MHLAKPFAQLCRFKMASDYPVIGGFSSSGLRACYKPCALAGILFSGDFSCWTPELRDRHKFWVAWKKRITYVREGGVRLRKAGFGKTVSLRKPWKKTCHLLFTEDVVRTFQGSHTVDNLRISSLPVSCLNRFSDNIHKFVNLSWWISSEARVSLETESESNHGNEMCKWPTVCYSEELLSVYAVLHCLPGAWTPLCTNVSSIRREGCCGQVDRMPCQGS